MSINGAHNLLLNDDCKQYTTYPKIELSNFLENSLLSLANIKPIYRYKVLHVNRNKLNYWSIKLLFDSFGIDMYKALIALNHKYIKCDFFTIYAYKKYIEKTLET